MKILLYGLGKLADRLERLIKKEHEIIGYTDSFAQIKTYHAKRFYQVSEINKIEFDYLVISVLERRTAWKIRESLISAYGIDKEKIIPFLCYAKSEIVENIIIDERKIDGIILGNSYAYYGYLPDYLDGKFVNLSSPYQDIYCSCKAFHRFMEKYKGVIEYIIFDLWDYNYFNIDLSLSKFQIDYLNVGGGNRQA